MGRTLNPHRVISVETQVPQICEQGTQQNAEPVVPEG